MAVALTYVSTVSVEETSAETFVSSSNNSITYSGLSASQSLTGASGVPVTKQAAFEVTMSSGTATINLAALTGALGATVDGTGLKVQVIKLKNKATNANAIRVVEGASNGYAFGGTFDITLPVGAEATMFFNEAAADIASGDRTIDVTGTGTQVLQVHVVMG